MPKPKKKEYGPAAGSDSDDDPESSPAAALPVSPPMAAKAMPTSPVHSDPHIASPPAGSGAGGKASKEELTTPERGKDGKGEKAEVGEDGEEGEEKEAKPLMWLCVACTYENTNLEGTHCEMCGTGKPANATTGESKEPAASTDNLPPEVRKAMQQFSTTPGQDGDGKDAVKESAPLPGTPPGSGPAAKSSSSGDKGTDQGTENTEIGARQPSAPPRDGSEPEQEEEKKSAPLSDSHKKFIEEANAALARHASGTSLPTGAPPPAPPQPQPSLKPASKVEDDDGPSNTATRPLRSMLLNKWPQAQQDQMRQALEQVQQILNGMGMRPEDTDLNDLTAEFGMRAFTSNTSQPRRVSIGGTTTYPPPPPEPAQQQMAPQPPAYGQSESWGAGASRPQQQQPGYSAQQQMNPMGSGNLSGNLRRESAGGLSIAGHRQVLAWQAEGHPDGVAFRNSKQDDAVFNIPNGKELELILEDGEWCCVKIGHAQGWVKRRNLRPPDQPLPDQQQQQPLPPQAPQAYGQQMGMEQQMGMHGGMNGGMNGPMNAMNGPMHSMQQGQYAQAPPQQMMPKPPPQPQVQFAQPPQRYGQIAQQQGMQQPMQHQYQQHQPQPPQQPQPPPQPPPAAGRGMAYPGVAAATPPPAAPPPAAPPPAAPAADTNGGGPGWY